MNFRFFIVDFMILFCPLFEGVTLSMLNIKVVNRAILVQWNYTGHVTETIRKYRLSYNLLPDPRITDIVVDANTHFAIIATGDHPGRLYNISLQVETDRGLTQISRSRFTRADCDARYYMQLKATLAITSPHYPDSYEPGVLCKWSVFTNSTYALGYYVKEADFGNLFPDCKNSYLSITSSGVRQYVCHSHVTKETRVSSFDVVFHSENKISGSGFKLILKAEVKSASPPSNITMKMSKGGILLSWSAPEGEYLPITSYLLDYTSLPGGMTHRITLSPRMSRYVIRVSGHEGQMFVINIRANIGNKMGVPKRLFFRPPCFHSVNLSNGNTINITSPSYPFNYPRGISCVWRIQTRIGETIQLKILFMDIEDDVFCSGDYLQISAQTERFCGRMTQEKVIMSITNSVDLKFFSDGSKTRKGFLVQAEAVGRTEPQSTDLTTVTSTGITTSSTIVSTTSATVELTSPSYVSQKLSTNYLQPEKSFSISNDQTTASVNHISNNSTSTRATSVASSSNTHFSQTTEYVSLQVGTTYSKSLNPDYMMNSTFLNYSLTSPSVSSSSSSRISTASSWSGWTSTYFSTHQQVEGTTQKESPRNYSNSVYFEPDVNDRMYSVYFNIRLERRITNKILIVNNTDDIKEQLRTKLIHAFQDKGMVCTLEVNDIIVGDNFKKAQVHFTVNYNMSDLLRRYYQNDSFRLIEHINKTTLEYLSRDVISDNWSIDAEYLSEVRENEIGKQEVFKPCDIMKTICNSNYTCVRMNGSSLGIVCCKTCIANVYPSCNVSTSDICKNTQNPISTQSQPTIRNDDKGNNSSTISIAVVVTVVSVLMTIVIGIVMAYIRKKKILCSKVDVKFQDRQGCIQIHDILQNKFVGDKNIEFTGFKIYRKYKNKRNIGGSLPSRNHAKHKMEEAIEAKVKQLGIFIEDTETLKKRLHLKCSLRRGNSF